MLSGKLWQICTNSRKKWEVELKTGTFESTLDDKGRVSIPARLRDFYSEDELVITQGMSPSVWIVPEKAWLRFAGRLENSDDLFSEDIDLLGFQYQYLIPAQVGEIDKSGRIAIPPAIRRYAKLVKDCMVLSFQGVQNTGFFPENRLEIWDAEHFYSYMQEQHLANLETMRKMRTPRSSGTRKPE